MNRKNAPFLVIVAVVAISAGYIFFKSRHSGPPVKTTIRVSVAPPEKLDFVVSKANTPLFKYLMSKKSGVKAGLSQQMEVKAVPGSALLEAKVGVMTTEEGKKYAEGFVETLQDICGKEVQLTLAEKTVK
jgi:hypothetical protein